MQPVQAGLTGWGRSISACHAISALSVYVAEEAEKCAEEGCSWEMPGGYTEKAAEELWKRKQRAAAEGVRSSALREASEALSRLKHEEKEEEAGYTIREEERKKKKKASPKCIEEAKTLAWRRKKQALLKRSPSEITKLRRTENFTKSFERYKARSAKQETNTEEEMSKADAKSQAASWQ